MSCSPFWQDERTPGDVIARQLATLALDRRTRGLQVDVFVRQGLLTLTGTVASSDQRTEAELVVRTVPGITAVVNCIDVRSTHTIRDGKARR